MLIVDKREATVNEEDTHENDYWILKLEVFHVMLALWKVKIFLKKCAAARRKRPFGRVYMIIMWSFY